MYIFGLQNLSRVANVVFERLECNFALKLHLQLRQGHAVIRALCFWLRHFEIQLFSKVKCIYISRVCDDCCVINLIVQCSRSLFNAIGYIDEQYSKCVSVIVYTVLNRRATFEQYIMCGQMSYNYNATQRQHFYKHIPSTEYKLNVSCVHSCVS